VTPSPDDSVPIPTKAKTLIYSVVDAIGKSEHGRRLLTKAVAVGNTGIGAGNHDFAGSRTGENRVIAAACAVLPNVVALDIGANHGSWGLEMLARSTDSRVVFIEPRARAATELRARLGNDPRGAVFETALGETDGEAILFGVGGAGDQASLRPDLLRRASIADVSDEAATEAVQLKTVDTLLNEVVETGLIESANSVNAAKVDIEGLEFAVLQQLLDSIGEQLALVQFEFHVHALAQGHTVGDFANLFGSQFELFRLAPRSLIPLSELPLEAANYFGYSNWLAVRRSFSTAVQDAYRKADPKMARPKEWIY
jgi:FkbM family methyltransferase